MPKIKFEKKDAIPEALREIAAEVDGGFEIDVVPASFREKNINLLKERDALATALGKVKEVTGTDDLEKLAAEFPELKRTAQLVADGKLTKKEEIEAEIAKRLNDQKGGLEAQIKTQADKAKAETDRAEKFAGLWRSSVVEQAITNAVLAEGSGANPAALPDILARARQTYRVTDDGKLVAMDGSNVLYGADGESSMKPGEWLGKVIKESPYLGKASIGGGATGDTDGPLKGVSPADLAKMSPEEKLSRFRNQK